MSGTLEALEAQRERNRRWRTANPKKAIKAIRQWQRKNKEKVAAYKRRWERNNPDKVRAKHQKWDRENRAKSNANKRRWKQTNPEPVTRGRIATALQIPPSLIPLPLVRLQIKLKKLKHYAKGH